MVPMDNLKRVVVNIFDQQIPLTSEGNEEEVREIARYVDDEMRSVANQVQSQDTRKIAIVASLNIAADLYQLRKQVEQLEARLASRANMISESIDHLLKTEQL